MGLAYPNIWHHIHFDAGGIYNAYKAWIPETGERVMTKKQLGQRLQERGFVSVKGAQGRRYWVGLRLAQDDDEDRPTQPGLFDQEFSSEIGGVRILWVCNIFTNPLILFCMVL